MQCIKFLVHKKAVSYKDLHELLTLTMLLIKTAFILSSALVLLELCY